MADGHPAWADDEDLQEKYGDRDWFPGGEGDEPTIEERVKDVETDRSTGSGQYRHIVGSVYWYSGGLRWLAEIPLLLLIALPADMVIENTSPFWSWLWEIDAEFSMWLVQNYQYYAFILFLVVLSSRLKLDPDDVTD